MEKFKGRIQAGIEYDKGAIQKNLEGYRQTLQLEMRPVYAQLDNLQFEHQTRFTKLHEKRVEVIAGLFERLVKVEARLDPYGSYSGFGPEGEDLSPDEWEHKATSEHWDFWMYYKQHSYWFSKSLCAEIETTHRAIVDATLAKWHYLSAQNNNNASDEYKYGSFEKAGKALEQIVAIRNEITDQLREILGVENNREGHPLLP